MTGRTVSYCLTGEIPETLLRHFEKPGLGFVVGHVVAVDLEKRQIKVKVHHVAGKPVFTVKVTGIGALQSVGNVVYLMNSPNDNTYEATLVSSEDAPEEELSETTEVEE